MARSYESMLIYDSNIGKDDQRSSHSMWQKALNMRKTIHGKEDGDLADSYHNLAIYFSNIGKDDQAIECCRKAINIRKKVHGD